MPRNIRFLAIGLALASLALGCATKKSVVDPSYTMPEGVASSELQLVTFFDAPNFKILMKDRGQLGRVDIGTDPNTIDSVMADLDTGAPRITPVQLYSPGTVRGMVFNNTAAEGMDIFRTEGNGAVRRIFDFAVPVDHRWIDGHSELYQFADLDPKRVANATYYSRGLIGGMAGASSPISNGSRPAPGTLTNIRYLAERFGTAAGGTYQAAESTFVMAWSPVAGAARYWIHVFEYQSTPLSLRNRILTGAPSPVSTIGARDVFIASVPASITQYRMGAPGAKIYTFRTPRRLAEYYVRISALDVNGQMIGMTLGPQITSTSDLRQIPDIRDYFADFTDPEVAGTSPPSYLLYSRGAVRVSPGEPPPTGAAPAN